MINKDKIKVSGVGSDNAGHLKEDSFIKNEALLDSSYIEDFPETIHLSNRQSQMLDAIVKGLRYKEIAFEYDISENTVAFHISKLKQRLNCVSSREIISKAIMHGLITIEKKQ